MLGEADAWRVADRIVQADLLAGRSTVARLATVFSVGR